MLFSRPSESLDLISHLPEEDRLEMAVHQDIVLSVRIPAWAGSASASVDGKVVPAAMKGVYMELCSISAGSKVQVLFDRVGESQLTESIAPGTYTTQWLGDTVVAIDPPGKVVLLYS